MSKWTNATLTADGQNLQAQLLDGGGFEFTKVTAADSSGTDKLTLTMQPSVIDGKTITVPVLLSNSNLSAGFTMNQLKFYARKTGIPAGDEIVYAIAEDETGDEIPSESDSPGFTIDWSYTFQFGNATSVNVSIDPAGLVSMALLGTPGGIATLNNAGAVPIEQGGTGAVTASAALAALGGMRASATGDDIPTSASDPTSISSQLSNLIADHGIKTYRDYTQIGLSGSEITIAQIFESLPAGSTLYANNTPTSCLTSTERPTVTVYGFLIARKVSSAFAIMEWHCPSNDDGSVIGNYTSAYRTVSSPSWSGWALEPTATPPQEFDLPLLDGWYTNYRAKYRKTQEGLVVVNAILELSEGYSASDSTQIAVLPEGFRPATSFMYPVSVQDGSTRASAIVQIGTNGTIIYYGASNTTAVFRIYLNAAFFAAS